MSAGSASRLRACFGFTLIELLVTLAVAVIIMTIAVPSFLGMMTSNRSASDYNEVLAGLNYARSEAIKCRSEVTFDISNSGGWSYTVTHTGTGGCSIRGMKRSSDRGVASSTESISFNALGRSNCGVGTPCNFSISGKPIVVYSTGRVGAPDGSES